MIKTLYEDSIACNKDFSVAILSDSLYRNLSHEIRRDSFYNILLSPLMFRPKDYFLYTRFSISQNEMFNFINYTYDFLLIEYLANYKYLHYKEEYSWMVKDYKTSHVCSIDYVNLGGYLLPITDSNYMDVCRFFPRNFNHVIFPELHSFGENNFTNSLFITQIVHYNRLYYKEYKAKQKKGICNYGLLNYKRIRPMNKICKEYVEKTIKLTFGFIRYK